MTKKKSTWMCSSITLHYNYQWLRNKFGFHDELTGTNEYGENVIISIDKNSAQIKTMQDNGYIRTNVYYPDGTTEELYER